jgi:AraC family transcriptional regulator
VQQAQMKTTRPAELEAPRVEHGRPLLITGLRSHFADEPWKGIPELWRRFAQHLGKIPGQAGRTAYGLCFLQASGVEYLAGVEVSRSSGLPSDFTTVSVPAQKYLVFSHREHVSKLHLRCATISARVTPRNLIRGLEWEASRYGLPSRSEIAGKDFQQSIRTKFETEWKQKLQPNVVLSCGRARCH